MLMGRELRLFKVRFEEVEMQLEAERKKCEDLVERNWTMDEVYWVRLCELKNEIQGLKHDGGGFAQVTDPYSD